MKLLVLCMLCAVDSIAIPSFFQNVSFRDYKALVPVVCTYELSVVTGVMAFKHSKDAVNDTLFTCNKKNNSNYAKTWGNTIYCKNVCN